MDTCDFCGQERGPEHDGEDLVFLGIRMPVRPCPNMPASWMGVSYPGEEMFVAEIDQGRAE